jgi:hypothetical protein
VAKYQVVIKIDLADRPEDHELTAALILISKRSSIEILQKGVSLDFALQMMLTFTGCRFLI